MLLKYFVPKLVTFCIFGKHANNCQKNAARFLEQTQGSRATVKSRYDEARKAEWNNFQEIKNQFGAASIVGNDRVVFNIKGNDYRLVVLVLFRRGKAFIRFVGTHKDYDKIDAKNI